MPLNPNPRTFTRNRVVVHTSPRFSCANGAGSFSTGTTSHQFIPGFTTTNYGGLFLSTPCLKGSDVEIDNTAAPDETVLGNTHPETERMTIPPPAVKRMHVVNSSGNKPGNTQMLARTFCKHFPNVQLFICERAFPKVKISFLWLPDAVLPGAGEFLK